MSNQQRINGEKQRGQSHHQPGSGSKYHEEHAGKVTGYGQPDPNAERADRPSI
ncbi:hypothetical protein [Neobacillus fumarioli]|uniref:hypothetical protein n=1 Tax=Neobacillus fumarioli TaxID=105229 RepID=UPI000ADC5C4C|nr:hypothetical protein [Neobacillus fumarioli]